MATPRSTASGMITFGMVSVPIRLYPAVSDQSYSFTNVHVTCGSQVKMPKQCPVCNVQVEVSDLTKAVKVGADLVHFTEDDVANLPLRSSKAIEIEGFIEEEGLPLLRLEKTYYVGPDDRNKTGQKGYQLLHAALLETGKLAVARMARSGKESLVVLRPLGQVLALSYLSWSAEVNDHAGVEETVEAATLSDAEMNMAKLLVDSMPDASGLLALAQDGYKAAVEAVVEAKLSGGNVVQMPVAKQADEGSDLMATLMASIEAAKAKVA